jgi:hypothetical protein
LGPGIPIFCSETELESRSSRERFLKQIASAYCGIVAKRKDYMSETTDSDTKPIHGALSRIDSNIVRAAMSAATGGHVFDLGLELNSRIPHNPDSCALPYHLPRHSREPGRSRRSNIRPRPSLAACMSALTWMHSFTYKKTASSSAAIRQGIRGPTAAGSATAWKPCRPSRPRSLPRHPAPKRLAAPTGSLRNHFDGSRAGTRPRWSRGAHGEDPRLRR